MSPDVATQGASVLGIVGLVVGLLVWSIRKIVDLVQAQMAAQMEATNKIGDRIVGELALVREELGQIRAEVSAARVDAGNGDLTPPPRTLKFRGG